MPTHTLFDPPAVPAGPQSPTAVRRRVHFGDALVLLFAPLVALGYHLAVAALKRAGRGHA